MTNRKFYKARSSSFRMTKVELENIVGLSESFTDLVRKGLIGKRIIDTRNGKESVVQDFLGYVPSKFCVRYDNGEFGIVEQEDFSQYNIISK